MACSGRLLFEGGVTGNNRYVLNIDNSHVLDFSTVPLMNRRAPIHRLRIDYWPLAAAMFSHAFVARSITSTIFSPLCFSQIKKKNVGKRIMESIHQKSIGVFKCGYLSVIVPANEISQQLKLWPISDSLVAVSGTATLSRHYHDQNRHNQCRVCASVSVLLISAILSIDWHFSSNR